MTNQAVEVRRVDLSIRELLGATNRFLEGRFLLMIGLTALAVVIGGTIPILVSGPMMIGLMLCFRRASRNEPFGLETVFEGFDHFKEGVIAKLVLLAVSILSFGLVLPPLLVMLLGVSVESDGLAALGAFGIVAVVLPLAGYMMVLTQFTFALLADQRADGIEAVKLACRGISTNLLPCGKLGAAAIGILFAGELLCGIGIFLALPVMHGMLWFAHLEVFGDVEPQPASTLDENLEPWSSESA